MKNIIRLWLLCFLITSIFGCGISSITQVNNSIVEYRNSSSKVTLGDTKEKVLSILIPTQSKLPITEQKEQESYIKDGKRIEIYYFRSKQEIDGLTTDDEFTPYIFTDGILTGTGWQVLGGPKSVGQTSPSTTVNVQPQKKQRCTTIYTSTKGYQTICR